MTARNMRKLLGIGGFKIMFKWLRRNLRRFTWVMLQTAVQHGSDIFWEGCDGDTEQWAANAWEDGAWAMLRYLKLTDYEPSWD